MPNTELQCRLASGDPQPQVAIFHEPLGPQILRGKARDDRPTRRTNRCHSATYLAVAATARDVAGLNSQLGRQIPGRCGCGGVIIVVINTWQRLQPLGQTPIMELHLSDLALKERGWLREVGRSEANPGHRLWQWPFRSQGTFSIQAIVDVQSHLPCGLFPSQSHGMPATIGHVCSPRDRSHPADVKHQTSTAYEPGLPVRHPAVAAIAQGEDRAIVFRFDFCNNRKILRSHVQGSGRGDLDVGLAIELPGRLVADSRCCWDCDTHGRTMIGYHIAQFRLGVGMLSHLQHQVLGSRADVECPQEQWRSRVSDNYLW